MVLPGLKYETSVEAEIPCDYFILPYVEKFEKLGLLNSQKRCLRDCIRHL